MGENICVAVRVRPTTISQDTSSSGTFWRVQDNQISLHKLHGTPISGIIYAFDHVFDETCSNSDVYDILTKDVIHAALHGVNGTAFAYGQTSSGKTFTMNGSPNDPGIILRAVNDIFHQIQLITDREFLIRVSYMEIYNEEINDLLAVQNQKLQIHESLERGTFVAGLKEEIVNNAEQVIKLLESGEVNRHFGETNMNARSSRSHTIFRMEIKSKGIDSDATRVSVLNLVDLAGSERIAKTGAGGVRLIEGKYINKSLMALGNVINKLSNDTKQRGHIPYRDSKLTRILQTALGGNAKTSIICTVAPEEVHVEETKGTLLFASRAKRITNCAQVNEILTDAALLKRQQLEIEELYMKLQASHSEVLEQEILNLRNDMLKYELEREKLEMELEEERRSNKEREQHIRDQQLKIENLSSLVSDSDRNSSQINRDPLATQLERMQSQIDQLQAELQILKHKVSVLETSNGGRHNYSLRKSVNSTPAPPLQFCIASWYLKQNCSYRNIEAPRSLRRTWMGYAAPAVGTLLAEHPYAYVEKMEVYVGNHVVALWLSVPTEKLGQLKDEEKKKKKKESKALPAEEVQALVSASDSDGESDDETNGKGDETLDESYTSSASKQVPDISRPRRSKRSKRKRAV